MTPLEESLVNGSSRRLCFNCRSDKLRPLIVLAKEGFPPYSPDGRWLAMGLGFYSLHGMQRLAGLELWGVDNGVPSLDKEEWRSERRGGLKRRGVRQLTNEAV